MQDNLKEFYYGLPIDYTEIIKSKAREYNMEPGEVLKWMILEFTLSSESERKSQSERRKKKADEYTEKYPSSPVREAFIAGYNAGWIGYQIRKHGNPFRTVK